MFPYIETKTSPRKLTWNLIQNDYQKADIKKECYRNKTGL